jgi:predicted cobalt transporter CbtA
MTAVTSSAFPATSGVELYLMVRTLLIRGMLAGFIAGLAAFGFAKVFGEPQVDRAIAFEAKMDAAKGEAPEPELVSREVQSTIGLATGVMVYSTAFGGILALVFAYASGRSGRISSRSLAALLATGGFVTLILVPALKYPANPPSVGNPETIGYRTEMYFLMMLISVLATILSINIGRKLVARYDIWNTAIFAAAVFVVIIAVAQFLLPDINEVPDEFPAVLLWRFRMSALGMQLVMWTSLGLVFGWLSERSLQTRFR